MKKFRMMLPVLAVVFAMASAVASDFLPSVQAYYKVSETACSTQTAAEQACIPSNNTALPLCTIDLGGGNHVQAFQNSNCTGILRYEE